MTRPTWAGSNQISLFSIAVKVFSATNPGGQVEFHQIERKTHERVHHKNVDEGGEVEKTDIVKGSEYAKNKYIEIDPEELKRGLHCRLSGIRSQTVGSRRNDHA
jgi:DNA end-binding protein Ku